MISFHPHGNDGAASTGYRTAGEVGHSRNGTSLGEILHVDSAEDPLKWLMIPTHWGKDLCGYSDADDFADVQAPELWALWQELNPGVKDPDPLAVDRTRVELQYYAEKFGGWDPMGLFEVTTWLHIPSPTVTALPVRAWVDDGPGLTAEMAALVVDPTAVQPPVVERFHTAALGEGIKATRHGLFDPEPGKDPDERGLWVAVRYAFAVPGRQAVVVVVATHTDLGRMAAAQSDLDEFVNTIILTFAGGAPAGTAPAPGPEAPVGS
jgi:hypothetical protein